MGIWRGRVGRRVRYVPAGYTDGSAAAGKRRQVRVRVPHGGEEAGLRLHRISEKVRGVAGATVWTIGHSTRELEEFLGLLGKFRIEALADVRSFPGSRRYPQYGKDALAASLSERAIDYAWLPALGGRRRASLNSPNTAWRNAAFRGYADYM